RLRQRPPALAGHTELDGLSPEQILSARHPVTLTAGSRIARALGRDRANVNTIHHHQIADAGELEVTGIAPGGVIEAIEPRTPWPHCCPTSSSPPRIPARSQPSSPTGNRARTTGTS